MPSVLNTNVYDEILPIKNEDAFDAGREIAVKEGILVGISSGSQISGPVEAAWTAGFAGLSNCPKITAPDMLSFRA